MHIIELRLLYCNEFGELSHNFLFPRSKNEFDFIKNNMVFTCILISIIITRTPLGNYYKIVNHYTENRISYKLCLQLSNDYRNIINFNKYYFYANNIEHVTAYLSV